MSIKIVGYRDRCPVFISPSDAFSIQQFAFSHSFSLAPTLVLQGELNLAYRFTYVPRAGDVIREWDNGKMEPFASLSDEDCKSLFQIAESAAEQTLKDQQVEEIFKRNNFMHFGSGS